MSYLIDNTILFYYLFHTIRKRRSICQAVIPSQERPHLRKPFDSLRPGMYDPVDLRWGFVKGSDRRGRAFPHSADGHLRRRDRDGRPRFRSLPETVEITARTKHIGGQMEGRRFRSRIRMHRGRTAPRKTRPECAVTDGFIQRGKDYEKRLCFLSGVVSPFCGLPDGGMRRFQIFGWRSGSGSRNIALIPGGTPEGGGGS